MQRSKEKKYKYSEINRLEDKNCKKYKICNESNKEYKIVNPETDPFQTDSRFMN